VFELVPRENREDRLSILYALTQSVTQDDGAGTQFMIHVQALVRPEGIPPQDQHRMEPLRVELTFSDRGIRTEGIRLAMRLVGQLGTDVGQLVTAGRDRSLSDVTPGTPDAGTSRAEDDQAPTGAAAASDGGSDHKVLMAGLDLGGGDAAAAAVAGGSDSLVYSLVGIDIISDGDDQRLPGLDGGATGNPVSNVVDGEQSAVAGPAAEAAAAAAAHGGVGASITAAATLKLQRLLSVDPLFVALSMIPATQPPAKKKDKKDDPSENQKKK
jgi:hypothetical protein